MGTRDQNPEPGASENQNQFSYGSGFNGSRMLCVIRTDTNPLGLVDTQTFGWPPVEEGAYESYWGDLWHKYDVSIWWQRHGLDRVVDQKFQFFITNEAQAEFLKSKRPDIWNFYALEGRRPHYAGTVLKRYII